MYKIIAAALVVVAATCSLAAKDIPAQVINWPQTGSPVIRITLGKFRDISSVAGQHSYLIDTTAESLWNKKISHLGFNLYLFDKNKVRIGDGWITLDDLTPGQRFFVGYGQSWCGETRDETKRLRATVDPHSPEKYRANGVVSNMPEFQEAFHCKAGSPMVNQNRCRVW